MRSASHTYLAALFLGLAAATSQGSDKITDPNEGPQKIASGPGYVLHRFNGFVEHGYFRGMSGTGIVIAHAVSPEFLRLDFR